MSQVLYKVIKDCMSTDIVLFSKLRMLTPVQSYHLYNNLREFCRIEDVQLSQVIIKVNQKLHDFQFLLKNQSTEQVEKFIINNLTIEIKKYVDC